MTLSRPDTGRRAPVNMVMTPNMQTSQPATVAPVALPELRAIGSTGSRPLTALADVEATVSIVAGRARLTLAEVAALEPGSIVPLDRGPEATVDILVNDHPAARGDVIVIDDHFAARVAELTPPRR